MPFKLHYTKALRILNNLNFLCSVYVIYAMYMLYVTQLSALHKKLRMFNTLNVLCSVYISRHTLAEYLQTKPALFRTVLIPPVYLFPWDAPVIRMRFGFTASLAEKCFAIQLTLGH